MKDAAYYRAYRAKRKAVGNPVASGTGDHAFYKRKRALQGRDRTTERGWGEFVFWDGEGISDGEERIGLSKTEWDARVRDRANDIFQERQNIEEPYWAALGSRGRLVVDATIHRGRKKRTNQFADIPSHLVALPDGHGATGDVLLGYADRVCDNLGLHSVDELVDWFVRNPRRTTWPRALDRARAELEPLKTKPRTHRYVMLANSREDVITDYSLTTKTCLDYLLAGAMKYRKARHVWFGSGYDSTMILRDFPRDVIAALLQNQTHTPVHVRYCNQEWSFAKPGCAGTVYAIHFTARKTLRIARFGPGPRFLRQGAKNVPNYDAKITLWDTFGFFQQMFVDALKDYAIAVPDLARMAEMKTKRSTFTEADTAAMQAYCISECKAGEALIHTLFGHFWRLGIHPARLDGAGAGAAAFLRKEGVKAHIAREPEHLAKPIAQAFFGGRIELAQLGTVRDLYSYDISSAYPHAASMLPSLHGEWKHESGFFGLVRCSYDFPEGLPLYPLPYRDRLGRICFSASGAGWYWQCEVNAARKFVERYGGHLDVTDAWSLKNVGPSPFAKVPHYYTERKAMKAAGDGAQLALKLVLNSIYGKTAQQVGGSYEKFPPYFALAWAGWITASTRARLLEAALLDPEAVIMFMTDGIYTSRPLALPVANGADTVLGGWESTRHSQGVFVQAGVYFVFDDRAGTWHAKYRGFNKDSFKGPSDIQATWAHGYESISVPVTRFVTFGSAITSPDIWEHRATWRTTMRELSINGHSPKRMAARDVRPAATGLIALVPVRNSWYGERGYEESVAYDSISLQPDTIDGVPAREFLAEVAEG